MAETRTHPESQPHHEETHPKQREEKKEAEGKADEPRGGNDPHNQQHLAHGAHLDESTRKSDNSLGSHSGGGNDHKAVAVNEPHHPEGRHHHDGPKDTTNHGRRDDARNKS